MTDDPGALFRTMLSEWERAVNQFGDAVSKRPEMSQFVGGATSVAAEMQAGVHRMMDRGLQFTNMPSRSDIDDLAKRLTGIEASLARIEAGLKVAPSDSPAQRPTRGRRIPAKLD